MTSCPHNFEDSPEQKDLVEGAEIEEDEEDYQVNDIHFNPCDKQLSNPK